MLYEMLFTTSSSFPHRIAIKYDNKDITYEQLNNLVINFASHLNMNETTPGVKAALFLPNEPNFIISFFALAKIKAVCVPLNIELKNSELEYYIRESSIQFVITSNKHIDRIQKLVQDSGFSVRIYNIDKTKKPERQLLPEAENNSYEHVDHDFLCQFSSGTTGLPKKIIRSQKKCFIESLNFVSTCNITESDRIFCSIPLFHAHGMFNCMLASIKSGAMLVLMKNPQPFMLQKQRAIEIITNEKITIFPGITYQFEILSTLSEKNDISSLRLCFSAGNKLKKDIFEKFLHKFGVPVRQLYGSTETGALCINLDDDIANSWDSVGKPINQIKIEIWNNDLRCIQNDCEGEIAVSSPAMTSGYVNMDKLNKSVFVNEFFLPGDRGIMTSDGMLTITGRKRRYIEVVGHKVNPEHVESILINNPSIREAIVTGIMDKKSGKEIIKVTIASERGYKESDVLNYCRKHLASYEIPQIIEIRDAIPDSTGKLRARLLN